MCAAWVHISPIPVYYQPKLCAVNVSWFNKRKRLYAGKGKKQKIPHTNDYRHRLCWWHSACGKYTCPCPIPAAQQVTRASMPTQTKQKMCFNQRGDISTLKGRSLKLVDKFTYLKRSVSSTENDIMRSFSQQQLCQYCCIDAPHRRWFSASRERLTAIA